MNDPPFENRLSRTLAKLDLLPRPLRTPIRTLFIGRMVRFVGAASLVIEELDQERAVVFIQNRPSVQNHIGGVHAAAMALIAETASGFVVGLNVPDSSVPLIKSMKVDFVRRAHGSLRAVAELTPEQRAQMHASERGEVTPKVTVSDDSGGQPILCTMVWAWTPKRK